LSAVREKQETGTARIRAGRSEEFIMNQGSVGVTKVTKSAGLGGIAIEKRSSRFTEFYG